MLDEVEYNLEELVVKLDAGWLYAYSDGFDFVGISEFEVLLDQEQKEGTRRLHCFLLFLRGEDDWITTVVVRVVVYVDVLYLQLTGPCGGFFQEHQLALLHVQIDYLAPFALAFSNKRHPHLFETYTEPHVHKLFHLLVFVVVSLLSELHSLLACDRLNCHQNDDLLLTNMAAYYQLLGECLQGEVNSENVIIIISP